MTITQRHDFEKRGENQRKVDQFEVHKAWNIIKVRKKNIDNAVESNARQTTQLKGTRLLITPKMDELHQLRVDISAIKGNGLGEDVNFHIDRTKDNRGFTILMIAAQNDDFFTAQK